MPKKHYMGIPLRTEHRYTIDPRGGGVWGGGMENSLHVEHNNTSEGEGIDKKKHFQMSYLCYGGGSKK